MVINEYINLSIVHLMYIAQLYPLTKDNNSWISNIVYKQRLKT